MTLIKKSAIVFASMVVLDVVFAKYTLATAAREPLTAALWAVAIQFCNMVVVTSFVQDRRMFGPCILGAFVGTYLAFFV